MTKNMPSVTGLIEATSILCLNQNSSLRLLIFSGPQLEFCSSFHWHFKWRRRRLILEVNTSILGYLYHKNEFIWHKLPSAHYSRNRSPTSIQFLFSSQVSIIGSDNCVTSRRLMDKVIIVETGHHHQVNSVPIVLAAFSICSPATSLSSCRSWGSGEISRARSRSWTWTNPRRIPRI